MYVYTQFLNNTKSKKLTKSKINDNTNTMDILKQHHATFRLQKFLCWNAETYLNTDRNWFDKAIKGYEAYLIRILYTNYA